MAILIPCTEPLLARRMGAAVIRLLCGVILLMTLTPARAAPPEHELKATFIY